MKFCIYLEDWNITLVDKIQPASEIVLTGSHFSFSFHIEM